MSFNASYKGVRYGSTLSFKSPGKNPDIPYIVNDASIGIKGVVCEE